MSCEDLPEAEKAADSADKWLRLTQEQRLDAVGNIPSWVRWSVTRVFQAKRRAENGLSWLSSDESTMPLAKLAANGLLMSMTLKVAQRINPEDPLLSLTGTAVAYTGGLSFSILFVKGVREFFERH